MNSVVDGRRGEDVDVQCEKHALRSGLKRSQVYTQKVERRSKRRKPASLENIRALKNGPYMHSEKKCAQHAANSFDSDSSPWMGQAKPLDTKVCVELQSSAREVTGFCPRSCTMEDVRSAMHDFLLSPLCCERAKARRVVWGKVKGWNVWPVQLLREQHYQGRKIGKNQSYVSFFGTRELYWLNLEKAVTPWLDGVHKGWYRTDKRRVSQKFIKAIHDVANFLLAEDEDADWCQKPCRSFCKLPMKRDGECGFSSSISQDSEGSNTSTDEVLAGSDPAKSNSYSTDVAWDNDFLRLDVMRTVMEKWVRDAADREKVLWAKIRGHSFWPVQKIPKYRWKFVLGDERKSEKKGLYMFFGTWQTAFIHSDKKSVLSWAAGVQAGCHEKTQSRAMFRNALMEVLSFLEPNLREVPLGWWSRPPAERARKSLDDNWIWPANLKTVSEAKAFELPAEFIESRPPKYQPLRRNIYPPDRKCRRLPVDEVPVCDCPIPPAGKLACGVDCINRVSRFTCDPQLCRHGDQCSNRAFNQLKSPKLKILYIGGARGWGVVAAEPLRSGVFVAEYVGEIIDDEECERRLWDSKRKGEENHYMMELSADMIIDARAKGSVARFINSSCEPNCEAMRWQDAGTGETRVGIFAVRNVQCGEEITYDYAYEDFDVKQSFKCECSSELCRKWLDAKPERLKRRGESVVIERDGQLQDAMITAYQPSNNSYKVMFADNSTAVLELDRIKDAPKKSGRKSRK